MFLIRPFISIFIFQFFQFALTEYSPVEITKIQKEKEWLQVSQTIVEAASFSHSENLKFIFSVQNSKPENMKNKVKELKGVYCLEPNPCLTQPCLPGIVGAIKTKNAIFFLLKNGHFTNDDFVWEGVSLYHGDSITIKGEIDSMIDIHGETFNVIEVRFLVKRE